MKDDWADEKKVSGLLGGGLLKKKAEKIAEQYPRQSKAIKESLQELSDCEKENSQEIDRSAGCFGRLMADLFVYKEDMWEETLRRMDFSWENIFTLWMLMKIWKRIFVSSVTIH